MIRVVKIAINSRLLRLVPLMCYCSHYTVFFFAFYRLYSDRSSTYTSHCNWYRYLLYSLWLSGRVQICSNTGPYMAYLINRLSYWSVQVSLFLHSYLYSSSTVFLIIKFSVVNVGDPFVAIVIPFQWSILGLICFLSTSRLPHNCWWHSIWHRKPFINTPSAEYVTQFFLLTHRRVSMWSICSRLLWFFVPAHCNTCMRLGQTLTNVPPVSTSLTLYVFVCVANVNLCLSYSIQYLQFSCFRLKRITVYVMLFSQ